MSPYSNFPTSPPAPARILYLRCQGVILSMGESIVSCSKWTVLAVCLSFTLGYIIEHLYLSPAAMPWFVYFKSMRTELVEEQDSSVGRW